MILTKTFHFLHTNIKLNFGQCKYFRKKGIRILGQWERLDQRAAEHLKI